MVNRMFINMILVSIVGGCTSAVYLGIEKWIYRYTSARFANYLNIVVLMTFFVPFYQLFSLFDHSTEMFTQYKLIVYTQPTGFKKEMFDLITETSLISILVNIWFAGIIVYVVTHIGLYVKWMNDIRRNSFEIPNPKWLDSFQEFSDLKGNNSSVILTSSDLVSQPCTTGIWKKYIIIPSCIVDKLNKGDIKIVLSHEVTHIKRNDSALKFFINILNCLHWFNPLFYFLRNHLNDWVEMSCDEDLTITLDMEQRKMYKRVLLMLLEEKKKRGRYAVYFGSKRRVKKMKRRILGIMKKDSRGSFACKMSICFIMFCTISGASMIAKAADLSVNEVFSENIEVVSNNELVPIDDSEIDDDFSDIKDVSDVKFIGENEAKHLHNYVDAKLKEHKKYSDGSCKVTIYNAKYCAGCDSYAKGDIYNEITYKLCRH